MDHETDKMLSDLAEEHGTALQKSYEVFLKLPNLTKKEYSDFQKLQWLANDVIEDMSAVKEKLVIEIEEETDLEKVNAILVDSGNLKRLSGKIEDLKNHALTMVTEHELECFDEVEQHFIPTYEAQSADQTKHWTNNLIGLPRMFIVSFLTGYVTAVRYGESELLSGFNDK
jgi:hypothetical protein